MSVNARRPRQGVVHVKRAPMLRAMSTLEYVDVATARSASGVRLVVSGLIPSPWSEAAKGLFRVGGIPVVGVRRMRDGAEISAWTGADNVPVVMHGAEPPRTDWAGITTLAARLAGPDVLIPSDPSARAETMGLLHEIAGEEGLGWNARLVMIDVTLATDGARGFPLAIGKRLAERYGYTPEAARIGRDRAVRQLALFGERLRAQQALGHTYLGGDRASALDIYLAAFLTPLSELSPEDCPGLMPILRQAFGCARAELGEHVPPELRAHRRVMFERHLAWPIVL